MFSNTGYLYDFEKNLSFDDSEAFIVCSCGHYRLETLERLRTQREGRKDWLFIYLAKGTGHFIFHDKTIGIGQGNAVLFQPGEKQDFYYLCKEKPEVYWIHFSGYQCKEWLNKLQFLNQKYFPVGIHSLYHHLFDSIIQELQMKSMEFETICASYAKELFVKMSREKYHIEHPGLGNDPAIQFTIEEMFRNYKQDCPISVYAQNCNMSISWFIRKFKQATGESPQQFLIKIRISRACDLLLNAGLTITEVAGLVGYENSLYFSRIFRKVMGISPSEYIQKKGWKTD